MNDLEKAIQFFDEYVNAALRKETDSYDALEVVKNYNLVRAELVKLSVPKE
jgi:hypothetical protein